MMTVFLFVLFGLLGGVFGGMGMGGGTLLVPLLTIFLSIDQKLAQFTNLIVFLPMAIVALVIHFKNKMVETQNLWLFILGGVVFSVLFSYLATLINSEVLKKCFGGFLILVAIYEIYCIFKKK